MAIYTGYLRRDISFCGVRAQSRLLLDRLEGLSGGETGQVGRRRHVAAAIEITAAKEIQAQAIALRQGRAVLRRGHFLAN